MKVNITPNKLQELCLKYSQKEIANIFNCSTRAIQYHIYKHNIVYSKNKINHFFFRSWNKHMAYILGFITADGSIDNKRPYLKVELNTKDEIVLDYIINHIQPTRNKLYYQHYDKRRGKTYNSVLLSLFSQTIVDDLKKFSIFPNKTGKHRVDFNIPKEYQRDYVRGFFDGDGSIYLRKNSYINSKISCQSIKFLEDIRNIINIDTNILVNCKPPEIRFPHNKSLKLRDFMYYDNCFCLERKKERFFNEK